MYCSFMPAAIHSAATHDGREKVHVPVREAIGFSQSAGKAVRGLFSPPG